MSICVLPYKRGLNSSKLLREAGCKLRYGTSNPKAGVAISWGMRTVPPWADRMKWINPPSTISLVSDKLKWAEWCARQNDPSLLEFTTNVDTAKQWASERGTMVVCRTVLNGHSGEGIVIARNPDQVVDAPLYSRYFKKNREYRIVYGPTVGVVYDASKRRPTDAELDRDSLLIRTLKSGYVYQAGVAPLPSTVVTAVAGCANRLATHRLRLLAYDVAYNSETDQAVVIEANTAWGLNEHSAPLTVTAMEQIGAVL